MYSVTGFIRQHSQPRGGYLPRKLFSEMMFSDEAELYPQEQEGPHATLMGLAVDYISRLLMGESVKEAFAISLMGASVVSDLTKAQAYASVIEQMDVSSISLYEAEAVFKLVRYDSAFRAGYLVYHQGMVRELTITQIDVHNLQVMVNRTKRFLDSYGPVISSGATFEGGYTPIITAGDMDFVTKGFIWDMKVSKNPPDKNGTMQLLCYYLLGQQSIHTVFDDVHSIGIFNPRLNAIYTLEIEQIPESVMNTVRQEIGCLVR